MRRRPSARSSRPPRVGSLPRTMFSRTVKLSASMKCWWTMPMPASMASAGLLEVDLAAVEQDRALVGAVHPVQGLHQRRLAGAVLPDDGVHLTAPHPQLDVAVGDDAGETLRDPAQLHGVRGAPARAAPRPGCHRSLLLRPWSASPSGAAAGCAAHGCSSAAVTTGSAVVTGSPDTGRDFGCARHSADRMMSHPGVLLGARPRVPGAGPSTRRRARAPHVRCTCARTRRRGRPEETRTRSERARVPHHRVVGTSMSPSMICWR